MNNVTNKKTNKETNKKTDEKNPNETNPNEKKLRTITTQELALLKQMRNVTGITAEYLMSFLDRFNSDTEQQLIYSMCCNFDRLKQTIELHLFDHGIYLSGTPHDPKAFSNITYVDVKLVEAIQTFLKEQQEVRIPKKILAN